MLETLRKLIGLFEREGLDYMLIGALALPAYGRTRATYDVDLALAARGIKSLERLYEKLVKEGFEIPAQPSVGMACAYMLDRENEVDVELWLRLDGIKFNRETLGRRWRVKLSKDLEAWIPCPEDFIVNKLAKADRGAIDEGDVISVLTRRKDKLDEKYLEKRARREGVHELLKTLKKRVSAVSA